MAESVTSRQMNAKYYFKCYKIGLIFVPGGLNLGRIRSISAPSRTRSERMSKTVSPGLDPSELICPNNPQILSMRDFHFRLVREI